MHILFNFTRMRNVVIILLVLICSSALQARSGEVALALPGECAANEKPNPVVFRFFKKQIQRKRAIASALAFPLPGGFLGLHRIYLGTRPYVPLVYVGTLGGCAGILPLIDFVNLVSNKDITRFQSNPHIFMWVDNEKK